MKKILKIIGILLLALILIAAVYVAYVFIAYYRIEDNQVLEPEQNSTQIMPVGTSTKIMSWNIGFGVYESDYGFFMDGGTESRAWSKERLTANIDNIAQKLLNEKADIYNIQEIDTDATRSYHVNEAEQIKGAFKTAGKNYSNVFAVNWDSPYLFYPFTCPIGSIKSGLLTMANYKITSSLRRSLPIETGFSKIIDLDRCYTASRIPADDGKELVLYNFHLSAYSSDVSIVENQMKMLIEDIQAEYEKGNYVIAGGDFNKDLLGDSSKYFGVSGEEFTWARPINMAQFDNTNIHPVAPFDEKAPIPSGRNADGPYNPEQFVITIDGFLVTDNVIVENANVINTEFENSDHNPVFMIFRLGK